MRFPRYLLTTLSAALLAAAPAIAHGQSTIVLRRGNDTISVERFTRSANSLEAEMVIKSAGARLRYEVALAPDGRPVRLTNRYWAAADSAGAAARQSAVLTFAGDTAVVAISAPGGTERTQRIPSKAGAFPHINPSFALWEPALGWAKRSSTTTLAMFTLAGARPSRRRSPGSARTRWSSTRRAAPSG